MATCSASRAFGTHRNDPTVAITSVTVKQPADNLLLSNSVRAGMRGLAKTLANEFGKDNSTINNICPG